LRGMKYLTKIITFLSPLLIFPHSSKHLQYQKWSIFHFQALWLFIKNNFNATRYYEVQGMVLSLLFFLLLSEDQKENGSFMLCIRKGKAPNVCAPLFPLFQEYFYLSNFSFLSTNRVFTMW
jgi:hypothetical protein